MTENKKTIIRISPSKIDDYQRCARLFDFRNNQNLEPMVRPAALDKGSLIHHMLETYYRTILEFQKDSKLNDALLRSEAAKKAIERGKDEANKTDLDIKTSEEVISTFQTYHQRYVNDNWSPIFVEQPFSFIIYEDNEFIVLLEGKIDLVVREGDRHDEKLPLILVDHKSGDKNYAPNILSLQFESYCLAFNTTTMIRNFIGFQKDPTLRFSRRPISYAPAFLEESRKWLVFWAFEMYRSMTEGIYPPRRAACFGCSFADVCSAPEDVRPFKLKMNYKTRAAHELFSVSASSIVVTNQEVK